MRIASAKQAFLAFTAAILLSAQAQANEPASSNPAAATVAMFYDTLSDTMKHAKSLGVEGRYRELAPAVDAAFDLPLMTKFAVGPAWESMTQADQLAVIAAFRRFTISDYAHSFDSYSGEHFAIDPNVAAHDPDRIVETKLIPAQGDPVTLNYRMRLDDGTWKIVDVFLQGFVSELATRRSEFASTVASGGSTPLVKKLDTLSANLMK